ncbi:MAG: hypothetical protein IC227_09170 [Enterococcus lacertideformus]|uniref:Uncharacterized protein n=1 Tax=Enterococcus lacertideformus TaxID=2771493 RepID=A0A931F917_9ENTE|nr:hypothetical protein [Enterococcus lacertideformus]
MPYVNQLQQYIDIAALSLSLKNNDCWFFSDNQKNYTTLFSIYIKMIEQDEDEFFTRISDKKKILRSLTRSQAYYSFYHESQFLHTLEQLTVNDPADFLLLSLEYFKKNTVTGHTYGLFICKHEKTYSFFLVDKAKIVINSSICVVTIPSENLASLCKEFFSDGYRIPVKDPICIFKKITEHSFAEVNELSYILHPQKEGNCLVKEIEATLKVALFHCRNNLFTSQNIKKVKWNDTPDSSLEMRIRFLSVIKDIYRKSPQYFDFLSELAKQRKEATNWDNLTIQTNKEIHHLIKKAFTSRSLPSRWIKRSYQ